MLELLILWGERFEEAYHNHTKKENKIFQQYKDLSDKDVRTQ